MLNLSTREAFKWIVSTLSQRHTLTSFATELNIWFHNRENEYQKSRAVLYKQEGNFEAALAIYDLFFQQMPTWDDLYYNLYKILAPAGKLKEAERAIQISALLLSFKYAFAGAPLSLPDDIFSLKKGSPYKCLGLWSIADDNFLRHLGTIYLINRGKLDEGITQVYLNSIKGKLIESYTQQDIYGISILNSMKSILQSQGKEILLQLPWESILEVETSNLFANYLQKLGNLFVNELEHLSPNINHQEQQKSYLIAKVLGLSKNIIENLSVNSAKSIYPQKDYSSFMIALFLNIIQDQINSQVINPLLFNNLELLDDNFPEIWSDFIIKELSSEPAKQAILTASSISSLSNLIANFPQGSQANNIEIAIAGYQAISQVIDYERSSNFWALQQLSLGNIYFQRIRGDRLKNQEQAIFYLENAFKVYKKHGKPQNCAATKYVLANVYSERIKGDRLENQERAIFCYREALEIFSQEEFLNKPMLVEILYNLGVCFSSLIKDDKSQNIENAILCYQNALQNHTRATNPVTWAAIQNSLASAYKDRIIGDRQQNFRLALYALNEALQVYTYDAFPKQWAMTKLNLASIYYELDSIQNNPQFLENAIAACQETLQVYTYQEFPNSWASTQNILGDVYTRQGEYETAIAFYRQALEIWTPTNNPINCFLIAKKLGDLAFFFTEQYFDAIEGYGLAIKSVETRRSWSNTDRRRQETIAEAIGVYEQMVIVCIKTGQLDKAIETVERSRSKHLVDLMASNDLYSGGKITDDVRQLLDEYESLQKQIDRERDRNDSENNSQGKINHNQNRVAWKASNENVKKLEEKKQQIWEQLRCLDPVLAGEIKIDAPDFSNMQKLIDRPTTVVVNFYITEYTTYIFILSWEKISCHKSHELDKEVVEDLISVSRRFLKRDCDLENDIIPSFLGNLLPNLAKRLEIDRIISKYLDGIEELIIVPHLYLHQIPFAALPIEDPEHQYLGDRFIIRVVPSLQVLEFCQQRSEIKDNLIYGIVENASDDLPFASIEGEYFSQIYNVPERLHLQGSDRATVDNYRRLLQTEKVHLIHCCHHAQSRLDNPLESALKLGDGNITLGQLMTPGWRMPNLLEVFLSCCETGFGRPEITDDILTISTGFLCAGARSVISTLWQVDDLATMLFSMFYYEYRQQGFDRSLSLQKAQMKLRNLDKNALSSILKQKLKQKEKYRRQLKQELNSYPEESPLYLECNRKLKNREQINNTLYQSLKQFKDTCSEDYPFSHPYYWSGFICSGLR